ncbi:transposase, IS4 family protein [Rhodobacteraceae bacterium KLH11]|nr:transposase, IS4 family protein [Rhodobacteraceae bacterium KLH11]
MQHQRFWAEAVLKLWMLRAFWQRLEADMSGYIEGAERSQTTLFPNRLEDWIDEDKLVRVIDLFVDEIDLEEIGFLRTGRPGYHPSVLLKLFIYGYLNRVPSSRALERKVCRNVEVMWLTERLAPDHKTIADFRRDKRLVGMAILDQCLSELSGQRALHNRQRTADLPVGT